MTNCEIAFLGWGEFIFRFKGCSRRRIEKI